MDGVFFHHRERHLACKHHTSAPTTPIPPAPHIGQMFLHPSLVWTAERLTDPAWAQRSCKSGGQQRASTINSECLMSSLRTSRSLPSEEETSPVSCSAWLEGNFEENRWTLVYTHIYALKIHHRIDARWFPYFAPWRLWSLITARNRSSHLRPSPRDLDN